MLTLSLDIGGTKIAAGLVDPDGALVHADSRPTPNGQRAEDVWALVQTLISEAVEVADGAVGAVGIGSAGPISLAGGTVSPVNIGCWRDFPLRDRVAAAVPGVPVHLAGDGLCMALGEQWRGAGQGARFLLGIVVSTGVGGGLVLDGVPYQGRSGNAGHVGHMVVDTGGMPCSCGGRGCAETIAAGPSMTRWARANGWAGDDAMALAEAAAAGEPVALQAFSRAADALAAMITSVAAVCDLDRVVVGGGVAKAGEVLFAPLRAALRDYAGLDFLTGLRVVPAALGGDAGLVGAARLVRLGASGHL